MSAKNEQRDAFYNANWVAGDQCHCGQCTLARDGGATRLKHLSTERAEKGAKK
jgi:hypothetical protein